jgi:hypothetical protein
MNKSWLVGMVTVTIAAILLGLAAWTAGVFKREPPRCEMCDRPIHVPTAFSAVVDGHEIWACCPLCGFGSCHEHGAGVTDAKATDFATGRRVPAEQCAYVEGSDLTPCCSRSVDVGPEKVCRTRCFDRCFPSLIAFARTTDAQQFAREHGGTILSYEILMRRMQMP